MKEYIWKFIRGFRLGPVMLLIHPKSALTERGWWRSFYKKVVVDKNNLPIPWWTYPFIDFLIPRLSGDFCVLEFGSGSSTIWLSRFVKQVISVEDHEEWANKIEGKIKNTSKILRVSSIEKVSEYEHLLPKDFDILIIDNLGDRLQCAKDHLSRLNQRGVVIWDNTDGNDWEIIKNYMASFGFKEISFSGMTAQELCLSKTTLFYRDQNCLFI